MARNGSEFLPSVVVGDRVQPTPAATYLTLYDRNRTHQIVRCVERYNSAHSIVVSLSCSFYVYHLEVIE